MPSSGDESEEQRRAKHEQLESVRVARYRTQKASERDLHCMLQDPQEMDVVRIFAEEELEKRRERSDRWRERRDREEDDECAIGGQSREVPSYRQGAFERRRREEEEDGGGLCESPYGYGGGRDWWNGRDSGAGFLLPPSQSSGTIGQSGSAVITAAPLTVARASQAPLLAPQPQAAAAAGQAALAAPGAPGVPGPAPQQLAQPPVQQQAQPPAQQQAQPPGQQQAQPLAQPPAQQLAQPPAQQFAQPTAQQLQQFYAWQAAQQQAAMQAAQQAAARRAQAAAGQRALQQLVQGIHPRYQYLRAPGGGGPAGDGQGVLAYPPVQQQAYAAQPPLWMPPNGVMPQQAAAGPANNLQVPPYGQGMASALGVPPMNGVGVLAAGAVAGQGAQAGAAGGVTEQALSQIQAQLRRIEISARSGTRGQELPPYMSPLEQFGTPDPRAAKLPACHVPVFRLGGDLPIDNWCYAMELHFKGNNIPPAMFTPIAMTKIDPIHTLEVQPYTNLPFIEFRDKLRTMFREPNLTAASLSELTGIKQNKDETYIAFMGRIRALTRKAFPIANTETLDAAAVNHFVQGIRDPDVAIALSSETRDVNTAVQMATAIAAGMAARESGRNRAKKATDHLCAAVDAGYSSTPRAYAETSHRDSQYRNPADYSEEESDTSDPEDPDPDALYYAPQRDGRGFRGRWRGGSATRGRQVRGGSNTCNRCGEQGHWAAECSRAQSENRRFNCDLCGGEHRMRDCPHKEEAANFVKTKQEKAPRTANRDEPSRQAEQRPAPAAAQPSAQRAAQPPKPTKEQLAFLADMSNVLIAVRTGCNRAMALPSVSRVSDFPESEGDAIQEQVPPEMEGRANRTYPTQRIENPKDPDESVVERERRVREAEELPQSEAASTSSVVRRVRVEDSEPTHSRRRYLLPEKGPMDLPAEVCGEPLRELFFRVIVIQNKRVWALIDSGSSRNLLSEETYKSLAARPRMRSPGRVQILTGDETPVELLGFVTLIVHVTGIDLYHEFGVIRDFPLRAVIGGELLRPHAACLAYGPTGENELTLRISECESCLEVRRAMQKGQDPQLQYCRRQVQRLMVLGDQRERMLTVPALEGGTPPAEVGIPAEPGAGTSSKDSDQRFQAICEALKVGTLSVAPDVLRRLKSVLFEHRGAFSVTDSDLGRTSLVRHTIRTTGTPFRDKVRPIPWARRALVEAEIQKLQKLGVITAAQPGECPYASAIVVVEKKDKSLRICVDYRKLNAQTIKDCYNLPRIDELLTQLSHARCFVSLDLLMGYHQIEMEPEDQEKTAFVCHQGLFVYRVMPFGLCNAPATFQRLMNTILRDNIGRDCVVYLDDVLIFAETAEDLLESMQSILAKIERAGLKCKTRKCVLFAKKILYLGYEISEGTIGPDMTKIEKIVQWPTPRNGTDIASFLGLCNYYRSLAPELAEVADVLYKKAHEKAILWTDELETAFVAIKRLLSSDRVVRLPDVAREFILETDASEIAAGAVLKQTIEDEQGNPCEYPVGFYSKALTATERRYSTYEREMLAVVKATRHYRVFLFGRPFVLRTDHAALKNIFSTKMKDTARIERWILALSPYVFEIESIPGKENIVADALSRVSWPELTGGTSERFEQRVESDDEDLLMVGVEAGGVPRGRRRAKLGVAAGAQRNVAPKADSDSSEEEEIDEPEAEVKPVAPTLEEIATAQKAEEEMVILREWIEAGEVLNPESTEGTSPFLIQCAQNLDSFKIEADCILIRDEDGSEKYRLFIPESLRESLVEFFHAGPMGAHEGHKKVCARVAAHYFWPFMKRDIRLQCARCDVCERFRCPGRTPRSPLRPIQTGFRGQIVALDVVGGKESLMESKEGYKCWLTIIDIFTKYAVAVPMQCQTAETITRAFLCSWILRFGAPHKVLTDQGRNFESELFLSLLTQWRIRKLRTTAFHPQCNGACERVNQTLKHSLRKLLLDDDLSTWPDMLPLVLFCYNTSTHSSTGFTPFYLTFGVESRIPADLIFPDALTDPAHSGSQLTRALAVAASAARASLRTTQKHEKDRYDSGITLRLFKVGDFVRVRISQIFRKTGSKLQPPWEGPYEIRAINGVNLQIYNPKRNKLTWIHTDRASNPQRIERALPEVEIAGNARKGKNGKNALQVPPERQGLPASENALQVPPERQGLPASENALQVPPERQGLPASENALQVPPERQGLPASENALQVPPERQGLPASENALQVPPESLPASGNALQVPPERQGLPASGNALQVPPVRQGLPASQTASASRRRVQDSDEEPNAGEPSASQPTTAPTTLPAVHATQAQPLTTRAGRPIRANRRNEYEYSLALMETRVAPMNHPNADAKGMAVAQDEQFVFSAKQTSLSRDADLYFIDRFTGTRFTWNDTLGEYVVDEAVQVHETPIIYTGSRTRIPGDNNILALFETPLSKDDVMPLKVGDRVLPMDQWPAANARFYGRSKAWTEKNIARNGRFSATGKRRPPVVYDPATRQWNVNITKQEAEILFCGGVSQVGGREGLEPVDASMFRTPYPPGPPRTGGQPAATPSVSGAMLHRFLSQATPAPTPASIVTPSVMAEVMASPEALEFQQRCQPLPQTEREARYKEFVRQQLAAKYAEQTLGAPMGGQPTAQPEPHAIGEITRRDTTSPTETEAGLLESDAPPPPPAPSSVAYQALRTIFAEPTEEQRAAHAAALAQAGLPGHGITTSGTPTPAAAQAEPSRSGTAASSTAAPTPSQLNHEAMVAAMQEAIARSRQTPLEAGVFLAMPSHAGTQLIVVNRADSAAEPAGTDRSRIPRSDGAGVVNRDPKRRRLVWMGRFDLAG